MPHDICVDCAKLFGDTSKGGIGMWKSTCVICGSTDKYCAVAHYDFGISEEQLERIKEFAEAMRKEAKDRGWMML